MSVVEDENVLRNLCNVSVIKQKWSRSDVDNELEHISIYDAFV